MPPTSASKPNNQQQDKHVRLSGRGPIYQRGENAEEAQITNSSKLISQFKTLRRQRGDDVLGSYAPLCMLNRAGERAGLAAHGIESAGDLEKLVMEE